MFFQKLNTLQIKTFQILFICLFFSGLQTQAQELTAEHILKKIQIEYSKRFDKNGRYIDNSALTNSFKTVQLDAIQYLKKNNFIGQTFQIRNTAMNDLLITVSILLEKNSHFAGLLIERNKYDHPDSEALLRLFNFPILKSGFSLFTMNGQSIIHIQANNITSENGAQITLKYPTDLNKKLTNQVQIQIVQGANGFLFYSPSNVLFSEMIMDVWFKIFSQNIGVKGISFK